MRISVKSLVILAALVLLLGGFSHAPTASAQVPMSPVERGYYDEGYQDGMNDAQMNRSSDYRRYRNKFENRYESFYMRGYQEGYNSIRPVATGPRTRRKPTTRDMVSVNTMRETTLVRHPNATKASMTHTMETIFVRAMQTAMKDEASNTIFFLAALAALSSPAIPLSLTRIRQANLFGRAALMIALTSLLPARWFRPWPFQVRA